MRIDPFCLRLKRKRYDNLAALPDQHLKHIKLPFATLVIVFIILLLLGGTDSRVAYRGMRQAVRLSVHVRVCGALPECSKLLWGDNLGYI